MLFAVHLIRMVLHGDSCYSARTLLDQRVFRLGLLLPSLVAFCVFAAGELAAVIMISN